MSIGVRGRKQLSGEKGSATIADSLQPGSTWKGGWTFEDPEFSGQNRSYKLVVTERSGDYFKVESFYADNESGTRTNVVGRT